jgi:hypothetical protein
MINQIKESISEEGQINNKQEKCRSSVELVGRDVLGRAMKDRRKRD